MSTTKSAILPKKDGERYPLEAAPMSDADREFWACGSRDGTCAHPEHHPIVVGEQRSDESDDRYALRKMVDGMTPLELAMMGIV